MVISTDEERDKIRVKDRPAACLAEIRQWIAERREGKLTAMEQIRDMELLAGWGAANLLCVVLEILEGEAT